MTKGKTSLLTQLQWAIEAAEKYRQALLSLQKRALPVSRGAVHIDVADEHREALVMIPSLQRVNPERSGGDNSVQNRRIMSCQIA